MEKILEIKEIYDNSSLNIMEKLGYAKGFTMYKTASLLEIEDDNKIILCDDLPEFINGYKIFCKDYDKNYKSIYCRDGITLNKIKNVIK